MEEGNSNHSSPRTRIYCIYYGYTKFARQSSVTGLPRERNTRVNYSVRFRFCLRYRWSQNEKLCKGRMVHILGALGRWHVSIEKKKMIHYCLGHQNRYTPHKMWQGNYSRFWCLPLPYRYFPLFPGMDMRCFCKEHILKCMRVLWYPSKGIKKLLSFYSRLQTTMGSAR